MILLTGQLLAGRLGLLQQIPENYSRPTTLAGVGKSCLLLRFTSDSFEDVSPTIGVDFKLKYLEMGGKKLKLTVWDTGAVPRLGSTGRVAQSSTARGPRRHEAACSVRGARDPGA